VILLDTHVFIWTVSDAGRLSRPAAREIEKAYGAGGCAIASIKLWERGGIKFRDIRGCPLLDRPSSFPPLPLATWLLFKKGVGITSPGVCCV
jgi:hypothetical protein